VTKIPVVYRCFVESAAGRNVNFDTNNGFDAGLDRFFIKLDGAEHGAMIGGGHRMHAELSGTLQQIVNANGTVQQAVLSVHVEMNEIRNIGSCHGIICFLVGCELRVACCVLRVVCCMMRVDLLDC